MTQRRSAGREPLGRPDRGRWPRRARRGARLCARRLRRPLLRRRRADRARAHRRAARPLGRLPRTCSAFGRRCRLTRRRCARSRLIDDTARSFRRARSSSTRRKSASTHSAGISRTIAWGKRSRAEVERAPGVERLADTVAAYASTPTRVRAELRGGRTVIGPARYRRRRPGFAARRAAGIAARPHRYGQSALTAILAHRLPHRRLFDRVPYPRRPIHARAAAGERDFAPSARASSG